MKEPREIRTQILDQGSVVLTPGGIVYRESDEIACICVDLVTKYARIAGYSSGGDEAPAIFLAATEDSLHLKPDVDRSDTTFLSFPDFAGWTIFIGDVSRYTLSVCLVKDRGPYIG